MERDVRNVLCVKDRAEFRRWLALHAESEPECWVCVKRGNPADGGFRYLDAVEEALCFGWIDSTQRVIGGERMQRFSPRAKNSPWTELNKERVRRLERLGLMTDAGRRVLPPMGPRSFRFDPEVAAALKQARVWSAFRAFPPLYQRVRAGNLASYRKRDPETYRSMLAHLIRETKKGRMYGDWNDGGRLTDGGDETDAGVGGPGAGTGVSHMLCVIAKLDDAATEKLNALRDSVLPGDSRPGPLYGHITVAAYTGDREADFIRSCRALLADVPPFEILYEKLTVFEETSIVVAVPRASETLTAMHHRIAEAYPDALNDWTRTELWVPHTTLLSGSLPELYGICETLNRRFTPFTAAVRGIAFSRVLPEGYEVVDRMALRSPETPGDG